LEEETIASLVTFPFYYGMYYERFVITGIADLSPAMHDYIFEDDCEEVSIVIDCTIEPWIWVVPIAQEYSLKARVIADRLERKLKEVGLRYEHWRTEL
jgi:hypothetical protein